MMIFFGGGKNYSEEKNDESCIIDADGTCDVISRCQF